jgi:hypothetical protein
MVMKKITFLLIAILVASGITSGQQLSIGIKPCLLLLESKYIEKPSTFGLKLSPRYSYGFGITIQEQLNKFFAFQIEPRLVAKGYNIDFGSGTCDIYKNNYISLPTLIFFHPLHNLTIELGPEFAYLINSKTRNYPAGSFYDYKSPYQKHFELSLISGISYTFFNRFDFGIRYGNSLTPYEKGKVIVNEDPFSTGTFDNITYKIINRYFEFYLNTRILSK